MQHVARNIDSIRKGILDALFPISCIRCEKDADVLCEVCYSLLPRQLKIFSGPKNSIFLAAHEYAHPLARELVHLLKYKSYYVCAPVLARTLYWIWQQRLSVHADYSITSVPLYHKKEKKRGFNQAELLAQELARAVNLRYENLLVRIRDTRSQTVLSKENRKANMSVAFAVCKARGAYQKNIILVDDVITTGSTMGEAAQALMAAGAKQVYGLAVAHG